VLALALAGLARKIRGRVRALPESYSSGLMTIWDNLAIAFAATNYTGGLKCSALPMFRTAVPDTPPGERLPSLQHVRGAEKSVR
jgi:hypothetical protein